MILKIDINNEKGLDSEYSFVKTNDKGIYIETIKEAYDSDLTVLRLYEGYSERKNVVLEFAFDVKEAYLLDLLENKITNLEINGNKVSFDIKPFEIITIGIK